MQHNDDDKDTFEDSEYHFSDDDVSFDDAENHSEKSSETAAPVTVAASNPNRSKRMLIGGISFIALVLVVYKFVAPTAPVVSTDITADTMTAQNAPLQANVPGSANVAAPANVAVSAPVAPAPVQAIPQAEPQLAQAAAPAPQQAAPAPQQVAALTASGLPMPGSPTPGAATQGAPVQATTMPAPGNDLASLPAPTAPASVAVPSADQYASQASMTPNVTSGMQAATQIQSSADQAISSIVATPQIPGGTVPTQAQLDAQTSQLMAQLQATYTQKLNDFNNQNQQLQGQIQSLDSKVASLESDLNRMMQMMTQQSQRTAPAAQQAVPAQQQSSNAGDMMPGQGMAQVDAKLNYNVQAIIPGRAWLRAQNGETVTVAEGDVVHDLGRITKIDPYDGIVEINTGNKVVSLSYGNVG